jgi:hypothetical protein
MVSHLAYSVQHAYQSSAAPTEQMMYSSNRLRSESGSSESSRGSGSTGSGKSRRRSHRPRGCRGGSNRRRNHGSEGKRAPPHDNPAPSLRDFHGKGAARGNSFAYNFQASNSYDVSLASQSAQYRLHGIYGDLSSASADLSFPEYEGSSSLGVSSFNCRVGDSFGRPEANVYGAMEHPVLQSSFSESSNEIIPGYDDGQILPPMPPNAFHKQRPIPTGPNPYALNASTPATNTLLPANTFGYNSAGVTMSYAASSMPPPATSAIDETHSRHPGILQPLSYVCSNSHHNINVAEIPGENMDKKFSFVSLDKLASWFPEIHDGYREERLEKQRQNVEGGSLFVTSPRSFLMGVKKSLSDSSAASSNPSAVFSF